MSNRLTEFLLPHIIGVMAHKTETLSVKAQKAQEAYLSKLAIGSRKTRKPVIIAFVGLVGSGKSSVAQELAKYIGGTIIEGDGIRIVLRKEGEAYKYVRQIAENIALEVIKRGGNVILDSDIVDDKKRASMRQKINKGGAQLLFVRTYADPDVMFGRMLAASYRKSPDDFFGGAKTNWKEGTGQQTGAVIKFHEAWRRTPHHYRWSSVGGGKWIPKKHPFKLAVDIDTTNPTDWKTKVKMFSEKLIG